MMENETDNMTIENDSVEETSTESFSEKSFLVADCGYSRTTVVLFDIVDGSYRLIASATMPTTAYEPWNDIGQGIEHAIDRLTKITGRLLLNSQGELIKPTRMNGSGVDHFTVVFSAAPPITTFLVGLSDDVSLASARRALSGNYTREVGTFSLSDTRRPGQQLQALIDSAPDLIFIVGGTDGGATNRLVELVEIVELSLDLFESASPPPVIFAGNKMLREQVTQLLGDQTAVTIADNVQPTLSTADIGDAMALVSDVYQTKKIESLLGMHVIKGWQSSPFLPTAHAVGAIVEFLAALHQSSVVSVDVGNSSVSLVVATSNNLELSVSTELGMGTAVTNLLSHVTPESIRQWIPLDLSDADILTFMHNKTIHPHTIPMNEQDLFIEQAIARELIKQTIANTLSASVDNSSDNKPATSNSLLPSFKLLLARGAVLANAPRLEQTILILLDALQPTGIFSVLLDQHGVLPALGAIAVHEPLVPIQSLEQGALINLGWVIAPSGKRAIGQKAVTISIESDNSEKVVVDVPYGSITRIPLSLGQSAKVIIKPSRQFDVGFGLGKGKTVTLHGGVLGIIIDVRGRPLEMTQQDKEPYQLMQEWLQALAG